MRVLVVFFIVVLSGCATSGANYQRLEVIPNGEAAIYVYRPYTFILGAAVPSVYLNGKRVGYLKNGGYQVYTVEPGETTVAVDSSMFDRPQLVRFEATEGQEVFIRMGSQVDAIYLSPAMATTSANFMIIPGDIALQEISETKLPN